MSEEIRSVSEQKELTGEQLQKLCNAIENAIEEDELPQLTRFDLDTRLNKITSSEKNYSKQVFELIDWAERHNKIRPLVIGASRRNPTNPELSRFIRDTILVLLLQEPIPDFTEAQLTELIATLRRVTDFSGVVLAALSQPNLPDVEVAAPKLKDYLLESEFGHDLKWLMILELFLKTYEGRTLEDKPFIVEFVDNLKTFSTGMIEDVLGRWLASLPQALQPVDKQQPEQSDFERPSDEALQQLKSHFVITVDYPQTTKSTKGNSVKAYLMTRLGDDTPLPIKPINLSISNTSDADDVNSQANSQEVTTELLVTLSDIKKYFPNWLLQAENLAFQQCRELQKKYQLSDTPGYDELMVEFWLNFDEIITPVDHWYVYGPRGRRGNCDFPLGTRYLVKVGCYDRLDVGSLFMSLRSTWRKAKTSQQKISDRPSESRTAHLDDWCNLKLLKESLQKSQQPILAISSACQVCSLDNSEQREDLFVWMLENGVAVSHWPRSDGLTTQQKDELKQRIQDLNQGDISTLIAQLLIDVKNARTLNQTVPLALWCDDPNRIDELRQYRERGRL